MTHLNDVQHPVHPEFQQQGPATNCVIDGVALGWLSCSAYGMAHLIDRVKMHLQQPLGCSVRRQVTPRDIRGGLTISQVAYVAETHYGIHIDVRVGPNVVSAAYVARRIRAGCPVVAQGDAIAFVGTAAQSTRGAVAHLVEFNEVRGGTLDEPAEVLMYDSAADGELHSWGRAAQSPMWISWKLAKKFMASLRPSGPGTPMIGSTGCYVGFGPDTEPHVHLRAGARRAKPFPDRARAKVDGVRVHSAPSKGSSTRYRLAAGELIRGYQVAIGDLYQGSREWLGNDDGTEWVHVKRLNHYQGGT